MSRWITKQLSPVTLSLFGPFPRSILQPRPIRRISRQIRFSFSPSLSPRRQGNAGILPKSKAFLFRFFLPSPVVALSLTPIYILFSAQKYPLSGHPLFFFSPFRDSTTLESHAQPHARLDSRGWANSPNTRITWPTFFPKNGIPFFVRKHRGGALTPPTSHPHQISECGRYCPYCSQKKWITSVYPTSSSLFTCSFLTHTGFSFFSFPPYLFLIFFFFSISFLFN